MSEFVVPKSIAKLIILPIILLLHLRFDDDNSLLNDLGILFLAVFPSVSG